MKSIAALALLGTKVYPAVSKVLVNKFDGQTSFDYSADFQTPEEN